MSNDKARPAGAPPVAATPAAITAEWLTAMWQHLGHDAEVATVTSRPIGTGQSAHSERFELTYARHAAAPDGQLLPTSLVAKLPHPDPTSRATGHVHGSYAREVGFYRHVAPTVQVRTPRCWYADIDTANSDFVLLLEDMAPARQGDQMRGCDVATARRAVVEIAGLHAPRWGDATLTELGFLAGAAAPDDATKAFAQAFFADCWASFVDRYRDRLEPAILRVGEGLLAHYAGYTRTYTGPRCPTHGDYRLDNVLIRDGDAGARIGVVDWQTAGIGCGASDVAYFLGAGLLPEARRANEQALVRAYHEALREGGVTGYDAETLWHDYAHHTYAGYVMAVIASKLVVRTERGDDMFMVMAHRHGQHALDVGAERLIAT